MKTKTYANSRIESLAENTELEKDEELHRINTLHYFTEAFKKQFKVRVTSTGLQRGGEPLHRDLYGYIVSPKGGLYAIAHPTEENKLSGEGTPNTTFYHSLIRAGEPVQSAGFFEYDGDNIVYINRSSGHYKPTEEQHQKTVMGLYAGGYLTPKTLIGGLEPAAGYKSIMKYDLEIQKIATQNEFGIQPLEFFLNEKATREIKHSLEDLDEHYRQLVGKSEVGIYHPEAVQQDFDVQKAQQILAGAKGVFTDKNGKSYKFLHKAKSGVLFFEPLF